MLYIFSEVVRLRSINERQRLLAYKYKQKVKRLQSKNRKKENMFSQPQMEASPNDILERARHHLTEQQQDFLACQLIQAKRTGRGRRWSDASKKLAVALHTQSPKGYKFLRSIFPLPSVSTVRNTMQNIRVEPGLTNAILEGLRERIKKLDKNERVCVLMFDEMAIKKEFFYDQKGDMVGGREDYGHLGNSKAAAAQALTFMIRSLKGGWKQALGYVLSKNGIKEEVLNKLVHEYISKLTEIGLSIKVIVCDQCGVNRKLFKNLGISVEKPFFVHNDTKVWCMVRLFGI